jgi:hypothetical protein
VNQQSASSAGAEPGANLTPAARELLDEYVDQYRRSLISEAARAGDQDADLRIYDIKKAAANNQASRKSLPYRVTWTVVLITLASVIAAAATSYGFLNNDSRLPTAAILVSTGSLLVALVSLVATWTAFQTSNDSRRRTEGFLQEVAELELLARSAAEKVSGLNDESLVKVLAALERQRVLTDRDALDFSRVMKLRNSLVHERVRNLHPEEQLDASRKIRKLSDKLQLAHSVPKFLGRRAASLAREASNYEELVHQALQRISPDVQIATLPDGQYVDFLVDDPKGSVSVVVKYMTRPPSRSDVLNIVRKTKRDRELPVLIVSNTEVSAEIGEFMSTRSHEGFAFVHWGGEHDDDMLASALNNLLRFAAS